MISMYEHLKNEHLVRVRELTRQVVKHPDWVSNTAAPVTYKSDYHWDNTESQYRYDWNADMLNSAVSKEPYVCKTVSDLDDCFKGLFNYDLEAMELAVNSPSVTVPRGLSEAELITWLNGEWKL